MTLEYAVAFSVAMLIWATLPGPGLAVVVSRALGSGPKAGLAVVTGLVTADFVFLGIAFVGLLAIATAMGPMFQVVKYAGAAYLIWRGYRAFVGADTSNAVEAGAGGAVWRDMGLGLLATLGNPKAILFFGAILPTFVDMTTVGLADFLVLAGIVAGVSYLVYGCCIVLADRTRHLMASTKAAKRLRQATGTILVGSGILVATR
jgi:threonine/homoserine/homoserine lactone efflux protein